LILLFGMLMLAACSREEVTRSVSAGAESWCRNSPDHCTVGTPR
jgi:hypothetical protein